MLLTVLVGLVGLLQWERWMVNGLDWNSDIIATADEEQRAHQDALSVYFGDQLNNVNLFPSYERMAETIGNFTDVSPSRIQHHNYLNMTAFLKEYALRYPHITHLYSAGKSAEGRDLWVLIVSDNPRQHEPGEPEVKYVANMHGNEVVGREAVLYLIAVLCENYGKNVYLTRLVDSVRIHLMSSMNPDGYERAQVGDRVGYSGRGNANGVDLNRNFPTRYPDHREQTGGQRPEPETVAVMRWMQSYPFVFSANLHGGSLVANYPFDDSVSGLDGVYTKAPDDRLVVQLAYTYARSHKTMWKTGRRCGLSTDGDSFLNGVTNGAAWYHLAGGMQDWQYDNSNCIEITVEMGCFKFPPPEMLIHLWAEHRFSMISFLSMADRGLRGFVRNSAGKPIKNALISTPSGKPVRSAADGDYWRLLPPGDHIILVSAAGYKNLTFNVTILIDYYVEENVTLIASECDTTEGKTNAVQTLMEVLSGVTKPLPVVLLGMDVRGSSLLRRLGHRLLCESPSNALSSSVAKTDLFIVPEFSASEHTAYVQSKHPHLVVLIAAGTPMSIVFSAGQYTPKLFNAVKFDASLQSSALSSLVDSCDSLLKSTKVSALVDSFALSDAFEIGVALGCSSTDTEKDDAVVDAILMTLLGLYRVDSVSEFSVIPSANPTDHFSPSEAIMATSAGVGRLENASCATTERVGEMKVLVMGSGRGSFTLLLAVEQKTEAMLYQLANELCDSRTGDGSIARIMTESTLLIVPEIPHTQPNCHDYGTIVPFQPLITAIIQRFPQVSFVVLFAAGGLKVRYVEAGNSPVREYAMAYASLHGSMSPDGPEICSGPESGRATVAPLTWKPMAWRAPDALLIQTACCYEQRGTQHLLAENRSPLLNLLTQRLQGISGTLMDANGLPVSPPVVVRVNNRSYDIPTAGYFQLYLPAGTFSVNVSKLGFAPIVFPVQVMSSHNSRVDIRLSPSSSLKSNTLLAVLIALLIILVIAAVLWNLCGCSSRGLHSSEWKEGFERLPLSVSGEYSDDSDSELHFAKIRR